jgi:hypothetical protein
MAGKRRKSFHVGDQLGLIAVPMATISGGSDRSVGPNLVDDGVQSKRVPTGVKTVGGVLMTVLVVVGLVVPPGPARDSPTPSQTGTSMPYAGLCAHLNAPVIFVSDHPMRELFDWLWMIQR